MACIFFTWSNIKSITMKSVQEKEIRVGAQEKVKWIADKEHSEITFRVKHMMITNVTGILSDYKIEAESTGKDFSSLQVNFTGKTDSISTGNEKRDEHLRSADFFDAAHNREIVFRSTSCSGKDNEFKITGDCTIGSVTRPITLDVSYHGMQKDPWGKIRAGFKVTGIIRRKEFGLTWNAPLEGGGVLVSEDVKIHCEVQMVKATPEEG
jgi:polyisoprenoid-binding protein YceI